MMHDTITQMMHDLMLNFILILKIDQKIRNLSKTPILKTLSFKNSYIEHLSNTTSIKQVIITQFSNIKSQFNQFSPIKQNPQSSQEPINPNFDNFKKSRNF